MCCLSPFTIKKDVKRRRKKKIQSEREKKFYREEATHIAYRSPSVHNAAAAQKETRMMGDLTRRDGAKKKAI